MRVLQVNAGDIVGVRFNNYGIKDLLAERGVDSRHLVWNRLSDDPAVGKIFDYPGSRRLNDAVSRLERDLSIHSTLQLHSFALPLQKVFREADLVHYHIVHDGYFSLMAMPLLSRLKPTVWTWHDPWPMTGHCIYPLECERWKTGCGACPALDLVFPMKRDRTALQFRQKRWIIPSSKLEVVLASRFMMDMARQSPIARDLRLTHIPFGIDLGRFKPGPSEAARRRLGIFEGRTVIGVRAFEGSPYKGFEYFVEALEKLNTEKPLAIVTTHAKGGLNKFIGQHQIIELGWVNDDQTMLDTYMAADFFVMPSLAEAFGMMAIEAMACGKPVIVFEGTSLPEVAFTPEVGIAVPMRDSEALAGAISRLIDDGAEVAVRGERGRRVAVEHYDARLFARRLAELYARVSARKPASQPITGAAA